MNIINEFFKKKTEKLSFIEVKPNSYVDINGYKIEPSIPLPLIIDELVEEIKENRAQEEVKVSAIINGMIYTIGVDPEFRHSSEYKKILYRYDEKIEGYILFKGISSFDKGELDEALVYFRSLVQLNDENIMGLYNYALGLEEKAKDLLSKGDEKKANVFLNKSTNVFEEITSIDSKFSIAYYKLGYHYKNSKQFKKSQLMWQKFLQLNDKEELLEEVRENLREIESNVIYEEGYTEILRGNCKEGLEKLLPLKEKYSSWWNLLFMIGLGYRQCGQYHKAKEEFEKVLDLFPNQLDALNEIGLCQASLGEYDKAIGNFSKVIDLKPKDFEVICNRGMTYLQVGDIKRALADIKRAYSINPNDEVTIACMNEIKKLKDVEE